MFGSLIAAFLSGETVVAVNRAKSAAITYAIAGLMGLCGAGFLLAALYIWMETRYGAIRSALYIAAGFFAIALVVVVVHRITAARQVELAERRRAKSISAMSAAAAIAAVPKMIGKNRSTVMSSLLGAALAGYSLYWIVRGVHGEDDEDD